MGFNLASSAGKLPRQVSNQPFVSSPLRDWNLATYKHLHPANMASAGKVLTQDQIDHFMEHGYLRLESCFSHAKASEWTETVWTRLGMSATDKTTWTQERINMPFHRSEHCRTFAPKAWAAICELLGGEDRVDDDWSGFWRDTLIVNLGKDEYEGTTYHASELKEWHVDGDFFMHYLDSPEQGLLVIPIFTDIKVGQHPLKPIEPNR